MKEAQIMPSVNTAISVRGAIAPIEAAKEHALVPLVETSSEHNMLRFFNPMRQNDPAGRTVIVARPI